MEGDPELADRIQAFPRRRTYLLPALHEIKNTYGWLPGPALELVGAHLRVPRSEVFGIASSFPDFVLDELILILMANNGIHATSTATQAMASRRFAGLVIQAFEACPQHAPLPPAARLASAAPHSLPQ